MPRKSLKKRKTNLIAEVLESRQLLTIDAISVGPTAETVAVEPDIDLQITFDEIVQPASGNITIRSGGDVVETIEVTSDAVLVAGTLVTINPSNPLPGGSEITIEVDPGAFVGVGETTTLFSEDFEDVELFEFVNESGGNGFDWSDEFPEGWVRDNTDTPTEDRDLEFFGWTVFDKEAWIAAAGNQSRDAFTLGDGNVVVSDPDEYDDHVDIDNDQYNVFLMTPEISLDGVGVGRARVSFDSSFRPYPSMTGLVDVSYDDGTTWTNLLTLDDSTVDGGTSSLARADIREDLAMNNPAGADSAIVRFGMVEAGNDWWWAIDNVEIADAAEGDTSGATSWTFSTRVVLNSPEQPNLVGSYGQYRPDLFE